MLSIIIISGTVALISWVRLRPLKLLHTLQSNSNQVGSEINDGTVIDVKPYGNMTEVHMDEFRPNMSPIKV